jgi:SET domain-containing protein
MNDEAANDHPLHPPEHLEIRSAPGRGRGVLATRFLVSGSTIEVAPVIVIPEAERTLINPTILSHYYYRWGQDQRDAAIGLGYASLYNHSFDPNAQYLKHTDRSVVEIVAIRDIEPGQEITVNYNGDPTSRKPLWFEPVE